MIIDQRGRGKYKPATNLTLDDVQSVLREKILEEKSLQGEIDLTGSLHYDNNKFNMVSLFCGAGGLDLGFELAGLQATIGDEQALEAFTNKDKYNALRGQSIFHTVLVNDFFKEAIETYKTNHPSHINHLEGDIRKVKEFPRANIVLGGFPCPGFSEAGPRLIDDKRNFLYLQFIRCLLQAKPEIFVAENVKGMLTLGRGRVFQQIVEDFEAVGYKVYHHLVNARDYGVPQIRERVFLIGVREDIDFKYEMPPTITHGKKVGMNPFVTLDDAIGDLQFDPGPTYKGSFSPIYMSRNRKKGWNDQSFTIQASGRHAPLHPGGTPMMKVDKDSWIFPNIEEDNRRLSIKEISRIQTFPDWYSFSTGSSEEFSKNGDINKVYKQIGNAVPVMLARAIARPIAEWVKLYLSNK